MLITIQVANTLEGTNIPIKVILTFHRFGKIYKIVEFSTK